jgi:hypothetical protein
MAIAFDYSQEKSEPGGYFSPNGEGYCKDGV